MSRYIESGFKIVIPQHDRSAVRYAAGKMIDKFGGVTQSSATGYWKHKGKIIKDRNVILESADIMSRSPKVLKQDRSFMRKLARDILHRTHEKEIMTEEEALRNVSFTKLSEVV
jgi:hypothetical protein